MPSSGMAMSLPVMIFSGSSEKLPEGIEKVRLRAEAFSPPATQETTRALEKLSLP